MEEEGPQLFELYDFLWTRHLVLLESPYPGGSIPEPEAVYALAAVSATEGNSTGATHVPPGQKPALRRSLGGAVAIATTSDSALLARRPGKLLHTILSGKEASDEELGDWHGEDGGHRGPRMEKQEARVDEIEGGYTESKRRHRERRRGASQDSRSKSLSELEFEELKGFMDLGFTFAEEAESDQRLLSIVPGLRRRASSEAGVARENKEVEGGCPEEPAVARPYLSEAWNAMADNHVEGSSSSSSAHDHRLRNWRVPATADGIDMKDHLRSWAHAVASAVR